MARGKNFAKVGVVALTVLISSALSNRVDASGFAILEQNGSGLGNAFAGIAAAAEDPSTVYFNAAGMARLERPAFAASVAGINFKSEFHDQGSRAAFGQPLGGNGGNVGGFSVVPAVYGVMPLNERMAVGLGINAPFGLTTDYDSGWKGRFQALKSEVTTMNFNPSFAWRLNDRVSIGIGADYQRVQAELGTAVNYTAVIAAVNPALVPGNLGLEGAGVIRGDDSVWGYDLGVLFQPTPQTRIGFAYRSRMKYKVAGTVAFTAPTTTSVGGTLVIAGARASQGPGGLADGPVTIDIELPASARLSAIQQLSDKLELLADVAWMQWSSVQELRAVRTNGVSLPPTPENWRDTWRFAVGASYAVDETLKLRAGLAHDQTPVPDSTRTPRLPDSDRQWLSIGAQWRISSTATLDGGYAHLLAKDAEIDEDAGNPNAYGLLLGEQKSKVDLLAAQFTMSF